MKLIILEMLKLFLFKKNLVNYSVLIFFTILLNNCAGSKKNLQEVPLNDKELYAQATNSLESNNFDAASNDFMKLSTEFAYSSYAPSSQYYEAVAKFKNNNFDAAEVAASDYIYLHPSGEFVEDAYYLRSMCNFKQMLPVGLSQEKAIKALESFVELTNRFPNSKYAQDTKNKIIFLNNHLAGQEMEIAGYYMKKSNFSAAIKRYTLLVRDYQSSLYIEEALYRLVEAYRNLGLANEAKKYAAILGKNYSNSSWYHKSYNLLLKSQ